jgi:hypothetical protein
LRYGDINGDARYTSEVLRELFSRLLVNMEVEIVKIAVSGRRDR